MNTCQMRWAIAVSFLACHFRNKNKWTRQTWSPGHRMSPDMVAKPQNVARQTWSPGHRMLPDRHGCQPTEFARHGRQATECRQTVMVARPQNVARETWLPAHRICHTHMVARPQNVARQTWLPAHRSCQTDMAARLQNVARQIWSPGHRMSPDRNGRQATECCQLEHLSCFRLLSGRSAYHFRLSVRPFVRLAKYTFSTNVQMFIKFTIQCAF
jgi:hypothetical protein